MLNTQTIVTATDITKRDGISFQAKILHVDMEPINRALKGRTEVVYYAELIDIPYSDVLMQGWRIYCRICDVCEKCVITSLSKDYLTVEKYNPFQKYIPYQQKYTIQYSDIESMLLSENAYSFKM